MDWIQALLLGVVQGLTEYLPISSSGHLILVPFLLGWPPHSQEFDLALHLGTAASLLWFFRVEWYLLVNGFLGGLVSSSARAENPNWRRALYILVGSVPAGIVGVLFEDVIERTFRSPLIIGTFLIVFGVLLWVADRVGGRHPRTNPPAPRGSGARSAVRRGRRRTTGSEPAPYEGGGGRSLTSVTWTDAVLIGLAQAVALMPGVSRSGITMTVGLFRGLTREAAARFSFLLSGPIIMAAALFKLRGGIPEAELGVFAVGVVSSAVVGCLAIGFLLRYLQRRSVGVFVVERIVVGLLTIALALRG